jgi:hypothetical protein
MNREFPGHKVHADTCPFSLETHSQLAMAGPADRPDVRQAWLQRAVRQGGAAAGAGRHGLRVIILVSGLCGNCG